MDQMLYLCVPQSSRSTLHVTASRDVEPERMLAEVVRAMDTLSPRTVHVPLSAVRNADGVDLFVVRLPAELTARLRESPVLGAAISEGDVTVVVVVGSTYSIGRGPPRDVAYLDQSGSPVASAVKLTQDNMPSPEEWVLELTGWVLELTPEAQELLGVKDSETVAIVSSAEPGHVDIATVGTLPRTFPAMLLEMMLKEKKVRRLRPGEVAGRGLEVVRFSDGYRLVLSSLLGKMLSVSDAEGTQNLEDQFGGTVGKVIAESGSGRVTLDTAAGKVRVPRQDITSARLLVVDEEGYAAYLEEEKRHFAKRRARAFRKEPATRKGAKKKTLSPEKQTVNEGTLRLRKLKRNVKKEMATRPAKEKTPNAATNKPAPGREQPRTATNKPAAGREQPRTATTKPAPGVGQSRRTVTTKTAPGVGQPRRTATTKTAPSAPPRRKAARTPRTGRVPKRRGGEKGAGGTTEDYLKLVAVTRNAEGLRALNKVERQIADKDVRGMRGADREAHKAGVVQTLRETAIYFAEQSGVSESILKALEERLTQAGEEYKQAKLKTQRVLDAMTGTKRRVKGPQTVAGALKLYARKVRRKYNKAAPGTNMVRLARELADANAAAANAAAPPRRRLEPNRVFKDLRAPQTQRAAPTGADRGAVIAHLKKVAFRRAQQTDRLLKGLPKKLRSNANVQLEAMRLARKALPTLTKSDQRLRARLMDLAQKRPSLFVIERGGLYLSDAARAYVEGERRKVLAGLGNGYVNYAESPIRRLARPKTQQALAPPYGLALPVELEYRTTAADAARRSRTNADDDVAIGANDGGAEKLTTALQKMGVHTGRPVGPTLRGQPLADAVGLLELLPGGPEAGVGYIDQLRKTVRPIGMEAAAKRGLDAELYENSKTDVRTRVAGAFLRALSYSLCGCELRDPLMRKKRIVARGACKEVRTPSEKSADRNGLIDYRASEAILVHTSHPMVDTKRQNWRSQSVNAPRRGGPGTLARRPTPRARNSDGNSWAREEEAFEGLFDEEVRPTARKRRPGLNAILATVKGSSSRKTNPTLDARPLVRDERLKREAAAKMDLKAFYELNPDDPDALAKRYEELRALMRSDVMPGLAYGLVRMLDYTGGRTYDLQPANARNINRATTGPRTQGATGMTTDQDNNVAPTQRVNNTSSYVVEQIIGLCDRGLDALLDDTILTHSRAKAGNARVDQIVGGARSAFDVPRYVQQTYGPLVDFNVSVPYVNGKKKVNYLQDVGVTIDRLFRGAAHEEHDKRSQIYALYRCHRLHELLYGTAWCQDSVSLNGTPGYTVPLAQRVDGEGVAPHVIMDLMIRGERTEAEKFFYRMRSQTATSKGAEHRETAFSRMLKMLQTAASQVITPRDVGAFFGRPYDKYQRLLTIHSGKVDNPLLYHERIREWVQEHGPGAALREVADHTSLPVFVANPWLANLVSKVSVQHFLVNAAGLAAKYAVAYEDIETSSRLKPLQTEVEGLRAKLQRLRATSSPSAAKLNERLKEKQALLKRAEALAGNFERWRGRFVAELRAAEARTGQKIDVKKPKTLRVAMWTLLRYCQTQKLHPELAKSTESAFITFTYSDVGDGARTSRGRLVFHDQMPKPRGKMTESEHDAWMQKAFKLQAVLPAKAKGCDTASGRKDAGKSKSCFLLGT